MGGIIYFIDFFVLRYISLSLVSLLNVVCVVLIGLNESVYGDCSRVFYYHMDYFLVLLLSLICF